MYSAYFSRHAARNDHRALLRGRQSRGGDAAGEDNPINVGAPKKKRSSIGPNEFDDACNDASHGIGALQAGDATAPPPPPPALRAPPLEAVLESVAPPVARAPGGPYFDEARRQAVIAAVAGARSEEERVKIVWAAFGRSGP